MELNIDSGFTQFPQDFEDKINDSNKRRILHDRYSKIIQTVRIYGQQVTRVIKNLEMKITNLENICCRSKIDVIFLTVEYIKHLKNEIKRKFIL
ncbi:hypothetical protein MXB_3227 [Myxobolus squamalis]|nr:hypothetical protein MXB_3227 [Myxobolus squamalis]